MKHGKWPQAFLDTCPDGILETLIWVTPGWLNVSMRILDPMTLDVKRFLLKSLVPYPDCNPTQTMTETQKAIFDEMHRALANCGAMSDLLCITGSFCDTLDDEEVLEMLKDWNTDAELALDKDAQDPVINP